MARVQGYFVGAEVFHPVSKKGEDRGVECWGLNRECPEARMIWHFSHLTHSGHIIPDIVDAYLLGPKE